MPPAFRRVLVLCTGNICRSPMAEAYLREAARARGLDLEVRSASVLGLDGRPAHPHAVAAMAELGIDLRAHRATPLDQRLVDWADRVLGMELLHVAEVHERFAGGFGKAGLLGRYGGVEEIDDPLGADLDAFRACRDLIVRCTDAMLAVLAAPAPADAAPAPPAG